MNFEKEYTTKEKKAEDDTKPEKEKTEKGKVELSNDAFALGKILDNLTSIMVNNGRIK